MKNLYCAFIIFCMSFLFTRPVFCQVIPAENDTLNYRLAGFSIPSHKKISTYTYEIAEGNFTDEKAFSAHIITDTTDKTNNIILELPRFGQAYTWRVTYQNKKNKPKGATELMHFSTGWVKHIDTTLYRLHTITPAAKKYKNMYVLTDAPAAMYDMDGNPVWYLPDIPDVSVFSRTVRDLKPTSQGTFTFVTDVSVIEVDYNGNVVWKGPNDGKVSGDSMEHYHHEFTRLANGHYMALGMENLVVELPATIDTSLLSRDPNLIKRNNRIYKQAQFGTLIEYDSLGNLIWSWKSSGYFTQEGNVPISIERRFVSLNTHMNAFYFNEKDSTIYISFKAISRILKIKYPSGKVIASYGSKTTQRQLLNGRPMKRKKENENRQIFSFQHNCRVSSSGYLYLFNNNMDRGGEGPSYISIFREPDSASAVLTKIWEFPCDIDTNAMPGTGTGGSVCMLEDGAILVCMGTASRIFIVDPQKNVLWNAISQNRDKTTDPWITTPGYRASYLPAKQKLKQYIFYHKLMKKP